MVTTANGTGSKTVRRYKHSRSASLTRTQEVRDYFLKHRHQKGWNDPSDSYQELMRQFPDVSKQSIYAQKPALLKLMAEQPAPATNGHIEPEAVVETLTAQNQHELVISFVELDKCPELIQQQVQQLVTLVHDLQIDVVNLKGKNAVLDEQVSGLKKELKAAQERTTFLKETAIGLLHRAG